MLNLPSVGVIPHVHPLITAKPSLRMQRVMPWEVHCPAMGMTP